MKVKFIFIDAIIIFLSFLLGYILRFYTKIFVFKGIPPFSPYFKLTIFAVSGWILIFYFLGIYRKKIFYNPVIELKNIIEGTFWTVIFLMAGTFLYRGFSYSRIAVGLGCLFSFLFLSIFHLLSLRFTEKKIVGIIGKGKEIEVLKKRISFYPEYFNFTEFENFENFYNFIQKGNRIDFLIYSGDILEIKKIEDILYTRNIKIYTLPNIPRIFLSGKIEDIDGLPLILFYRTPLNQFPNYLLKNLFDILFGMIIFLIFSIFLPFISLFIKIDSKGPIFYRQKRIGKDGKIFYIFKFRTMKYPYSESQPFTSPDDPRLTRIGKFLRRYNIDELPQIFNVLSGDMSLVGPRPIYIKDSLFFNIPEFSLRLSVKPGITGWAQIHGLRGGRIEPEERIKYDIYYIENWSIFLDIAILIYSIFSFKNAF